MPIGDGAEGSIRGVAVSPDGKIVAVGGQTGAEWDKTFSIYLFNPDTGTIISRITSLSDRINHLAFSKDGKYLAAMLNKNGGLRVYETRNRALAYQDTEYGNDSHWAEFDATGRLATTSLDGFLRLYDKSFKLIAKQMSPGGKEPYSARFSPDGQKIAAGFWDSKKVDVLSANDLSYLYSPDTTEQDDKNKKYHNLASVVWSSDGKFIFAGGQNEPKSYIRRWSGEGRGEYTDIHAAANTIFHILPLKNNRIVFGTGDPAFGILDSDGNKTLFKESSIADFREKNNNLSSKQEIGVADYRSEHDNLMVSAKGDEVRFGFDRMERTARFSVFSHTLSESGEKSGLIFPSSLVRHFSIEGVHTNSPIFSKGSDKKTLKLNESELLRSFAIASSDNKWFLLGTSSYLRLFDSEGNPKWAVKSPSEAWGVNISGNNRVAVAGLGDGTIRWYSMTDGQELLALFPHKDGKRWVLWTPSGYYAASPGGEELIGFYVNNGKDAAPSFKPISQFKATYYRPDITEKILVTLDEKEAVRLANQGAGKKQDEIASAQPVRKPEEAAPRTTDEKQPSTDPILRIETGMHTQAIWKMSADEKKRILVTGSDDSTVRIWDIETGELKKVLRVPIYKKGTINIKTVALSPDGKIIAVGGQRTRSIYFFNSDTGEIIFKIDTPPGYISSLAFSKDGKYLVATTGIGVGIWVYETRSWTLEYADAYYDNDCFSADFDTFGRLVTTSWDGFVRLYDKSFRLIAKQKYPENSNSSPYFAGFSPDGQKIAVIFNGSKKVDVLSAKDLSYLYSPDTGGMSRISSVAWSSDGGFLFAGGYGEGFFIRKWMQEGEGDYTDIPAGVYNTIFDILPLKDNRIAFAAADPAFGILDSDGNKTLFKGASIADHRGNNLQGFMVSADGNTVRFGYDRWGKRPAKFSVSSRALSESGDNTGLTSPIIQGLEISDWFNSSDPKLKGKRIPIDRESSRSIAISPDKKSFLLGANSVYLFDSAGKQEWRVSVNSTAWGVNISGDGKKAVAALGDGTIRWYRMTDGEELLAFFPHQDGKRWVLWTPSGYYDASPGGEDLIGWHINRRWDQVADFYPASRFRDTYYRPDIIGKMLTTLDEKEAIRLANEEAGRKQEEVAIQQILPPKVMILSPKDDTEISAPEITLSYQADTPSDAPITEVKVLIDGRPLSEAKGFDVRKRETAQAKNEIKIRIPEKDCKVSVIAYNRNAASTESVISLKWKGKTPVEDLSKPKLYVLAIGVANYKDTALQLRFAAKDAKDFVSVLEKQKGKHYGDVVTLLKQDASRADVLEGFDWLEKNAKKEDTAMIFISGHGMNDSYGSYYFLAADANPEKIKSTGVLYSDIKNTMGNLPSKVLLFLDTCHAGNVTGEGRGGAGMDVTRVVNDLSSAENGVVVFASSTGRQYSLEDARWGNGAFTKALVEGLEGGADLLKKGKITISLLNAFVCDRVTEMTGGKQTPVNNTPKSVTDFTIAVK